MRCKPLKRLGPVREIVECPSPTPGTRTYFVVDQNEQPKAVIALRERGGDLVVDAISVKESRDQRQRLGTRLYEFATELACAQRKRLISDFERSLYAEAFWRKQVGKGRAVCAESGRGVVFFPPTAALTAAEKAKLPQPEGAAWPCYRYGVTKPCAVTSLEGVRRRRRRR